MHVLNQVSLVLATLFLMAPAITLVGEHVVSGLARKDSGKHER
jgi:hypothetical protein